MSGLNSMKTIGIEITPLPFSGYPTYMQLLLLSMPNLQCFGSCRTLLQLLKLPTALTKCPQLLLLQLLDPSTAASIAQSLQMLDTFTAAIQLPYVHCFPSSIFRCWPIHSCFHRAISSDDGPIYSCYTAAQCPLLPLLRPLTHLQLLPPRSFRCWKHLQLLYRSSISTAFPPSAARPIYILQLLT